MALTGFPSLVWYFVVKKLNWVSVFIPLHFSLAASSGGCIRPLLTGRERIFTAVHLI